MPKSQKVKKHGPARKAVAMLIAATIIIIIFLIIALLLAPKGIPEFTITDRKGSWEAQGDLIVFDNTIKPGSEGEYQFILKNDSDQTLIYEFELREQPEIQGIEFEPFMQYRLKMNNKYMDNGEWHYADGIDYYDIEILPGAEQIMTLEWKWDFEGNDKNDTLIGHAGGELTVVFFVWAEVKVQ